jgi:hypothetical protein
LDEAAPEHFHSIVAGQVYVFRDGYVQEGSRKWTTTSNKLVLKYKGKTPNLLKLDDEGWQDCKKHLKTTPLRKLPLGEMGIITGTLIGFPVQDGNKVVSTIAQVDAKARLVIPAALAREFLHQ